MERRRPNRELKNSEDVQDALIEDYFRYNDLSRMEADDILMNISEIESPNYEYVELDLLNLPRDLSTNLNEDFDNPKENVIPNKRFRMVTDEETDGFFLEENLNKNTKTRTKSYMKVIADFFTSIDEERAPGQIPPKELDSIMARFFVGVLKKDGTEYEPDSLGSMYNSLDRHLRDMKSQIGYVLTFLSFKIVNIHHKFAGYLIRQCEY
jgi:hypothetical protein